MAHHKSNAEKKIAKPIQAFVICLPHQYQSVNNNDYNFLNFSDEPAFLHFDNDGSVIFILSRDYLDNYSILSIILNMPHDNIGRVNKYFEICDNHVVLITSQCKYYYCYKRRGFFFSAS